jgi:demethylmenaquinone methyltransferase/2-methoxy-6-polyprenyl-1,4-benzoquinol methylase
MLDNSLFSNHKLPMQTTQRKSSIANPESEWFGFRRVRPEDKTGMVQNVFASVASNYDLMNDLMSGGLHRLWKAHLIRLMDPKPGQTILDVAGGTGDIALGCYKKSKGKASITVCDLNPAMLEQGRAKALDNGILGNTINWITGNAEELPLPSHSIDIYSIAFGLRNVTRIDKALAEAARVLKPGGRFFCMEFSPGVVPALKPVYEQYCLRILPWLGEHVARDRKAYQYLAESILRFPPQAKLAKRMEKAGLTNPKWHNLTGGIAVIHRGWKI